MTPQGKMLAFQTAETNLTDINAHFLVPLESPVIFPGISKDLLHPVIKQTAGTYTQWENDTFSVPAYTTQVYVDKEIEPVRPGNNSIRFDLNMISRGGMFFGRYCESYQVLVSEDIPEGIAGMIPVNVQIAKNPALPALDGYHNEGIAFNGTGYS